jgi:hypothetical protein
VFSVTLRVDTAEAQIALLDFKNAAPRVISGAINETLLEIRTAFRRDIKKLINISQKSLDSRIHITKSKPLTLMGQISLSYEKIPGISPSNFAARQTQKGVTYKIGPRSKRQLIPGAFIRTAKGREHVFVRYFDPYRVPQRKRRKRPSGISEERVKRYKLRRVTGVSPWGAYTRAPRLLEKHTAEAQAALTKNVGQRIRFERLKRTGQIRRR